MKQPKILFFLAGPVPSDAERLAAFDLGVPVSFRNALHVTRIDEDCDGVAGSIPEAYADYATAEQALKAYKAEVKAARAKLAEVGGKPTDAQSGNAENKGPQEGTANAAGDANDSTGTTGAPVSDEDAALAAAAAEAAGGTAAKAGKPEGWQGNKK